MDGLDGMDEHTGAWGEATTCACASHNVRLRMRPSACRGQEATHLHRHRARKRQGERHGDLGPGVANIAMRKALGHLTHLLCEHSSMRVRTARSHAPSPTLSPTDPVPRGLLTPCPAASSGPQGQ